MPHYILERRLMAGYFWDTVSYWSSQVFTVAASLARGFLVEWWE